VTHIHIHTYTHSKKKERTKGRKNERTKEQRREMVTKEEERVPFLLFFSPLSKRAALAKHTETRRLKSDAKQMEKTRGGKGDRKRKGVRE
jgi:hypothetical protein